MYGDRQSDCTTAIDDIQYTKTLDFFKNNKHQTLAEKSGNQLATLYTLSNRLFCRPCDGLCDFLPGSIDFVYKSETVSQLFRDR